MKQSRYFLDLSMILTFQNCSTLHCTKWTVIICDDTNCKNYNKSLHEPLCTESVCTNIAQRVDYIFYYYETRITNATLTLFTQKISLNVPFIDQEVNVRFVLTNQSVDTVVKFSGNPGYINNLPVIVSYNQNNYTNTFYNTSMIQKYLTHPENKHGICAMSNITDNFVLFGQNKKVKCRYFLALNKIRNETELCKHIQNYLKKILGLNKKVVVSPYGNPQNIKDEEWIPLKVAEIEHPLYGSFKKHSTLQCYNLIIGISYIFAYVDAAEADTKRENRILSAKLELTARNVTFNLVEMSTVVSVDTIFIDETKSSTYEYAGGPQLNIHLPKDFFFPFPSSKACIIMFKFHLYVVIITSVAVFINK